MRIAYVEMEAFRGVRDPLRIDFGTGFTVISGRNGTGKSTICDAIEYAITGSISRLAGKKERRESLTDYIWWRGENNYRPGRVVVGLVDDLGRVHSIERIGDQLAETSIDACTALLGEAGAGSRLTDLCRTAIIRSESISELSLDLPETERFDLVKTAIGDVDFADIERTFAEALSSLDLTIKQINASYTDTRSEKLRIEADLSRARAEASKSKEAELAASRLRATLGVRDVDVATLTQLAQKAIAEARQKAFAINDVLPKIESSGQEAGLSDSHLSDLQTRDQAARKELDDANAALKEHDALLQKERDQNPTIAGLRELIETGRRLHLQDGKCPLCGSVIDAADYNKHLAEVEGRIKTETARLAELGERKLVLQRDRDQKFVTAERAHLAFREAQVRSQARSSALQGAYEALARVGLTVTGQIGFIVESLKDEIKTLEKTLVSLQNDLIILEASRQFQRVAELERAAEASSKDLAKFDRNLMHTANAREKIKTAIDATKRFAGEVVDDRLAAISPLLQELYARLRPHVGWRELDYRIRGDIRRFLSLSVGNGLNPAFLFSSGQRRAAGLAFLLAINLARGSSDANFLVLDDPVQHVDDFRALHLVEVLSSVRQTKRQVICTMEDEDLAALLCRRLRANEHESGVFVRMAFRPTTGVSTDEKQVIRPLPKDVLQTRAA